jgi:flavin-dependent dehydrogenase
VIARGDAGRYLGGFLARPEVRTRLRQAPGVPVRRLLPLKPLPKTYGDRVLVIGDAGGFTKPTTGGGIFYSLLTASLAAEAIVDAFNAGRFDDAFLARYETRWQARLGQELRVAEWLRGLVARCKDAEIDTLVQALGAGDVQAIVRHTARFNWHRDLILALARQPGIAALLVRALLR